MYVNALSRKLLKTDKGQRKVVVTSARKVVVTSARNTLVYFRTSFIRPAKD